MYSNRCMALFLLLMSLAVQPAAAQTAEDLFNDGVLHEVHLRVYPADWESLRVNFTENTYYPANLEWNGILVQAVGIRSRGVGSRSGTKPGLRVDFDRYERDQTFLGLKSVMLDNSSQDASMMKERLAMALFRRMGMPAPRQAHARLFVNGEYAGLYVIVEPIDRLFLRLNFGEDSGYLYQYQWVEPFYFDYRGPEPEMYSPVMFEPQNHETDPEPGPITEMIRVANEASDEDFAGAISDFVDPRVLAKHLAIENFIAEIDGITGYAGMNNFYMYRFAGRNFSHFLPWDKDVAFHSSEHDVLYNLDQNVLTRRMMGVPEIRQAYFEALREAADLAGGAGGWLEQEVDRIYWQIRTAALEDPMKQCIGADCGLANCTNERFEEEAGRMRTFARERRESVLAQLPGGLAQR